MTEEQRTAYIWTKYRAPAAEKHADSSSSSDGASPGNSSTVSQDYARASSGEASEYSSMNISTPGDEYGMRFAANILNTVLICWLLSDNEAEVCNYTPFDQLVRVASLAGIEHMQDREASEALLCLHRAH